MAFDFNGSSDYLELTTALVTAPPLTLFARFSPDTIAAGSGALVALSGSSGTHIFQLRRQTDTVQAVASEGATVAIAATGGGLVVGDGYAAAAVFESSTSRTVHIGPGASVTDTTPCSPVSLDRTNVGVRWNAGARSTFFDGTILEVAIWNAAITNADFTALHNGASPMVVKPASLVAYFPLIRNANDIMENRAFTASGTTVAAHRPMRRPVGPIYS